MKASEIHAILMAESNRAELPTAYRNDVIVHDLTTLETTGSQHFLWVLRESGSHLITLDVPLEGARVTAASYLLAVGRAYASQPHLYYHFDGGLSPVSYAEAEQIAIKFGSNKRPAQPVTMEYREDIGRDILITREQWGSLVRKYEQNPDGSKTFAEFLNRVNESHSWISINWCGMYVGIEPDGHAHT
jgi:hypothetical protein